MSRNFEDGKKQSNRPEDSSPRSADGASSKCRPDSIPVQDIIGQLGDNIEGASILERAVLAARNGIVITDATKEDNPIIYANPSFYELSGYEQADVLGRNCRFLQGDDRRQESIDAIRAAINEERSIMTVLRNYRKDGTLFWNELTISPVHDRAGKLINFIGIQNDITARIESERRISEFYSMVSHELRTPLTSIRTSLNLLEEDEKTILSQDSIELIEIAYRNTDRLLRLVNDILDLRKIESGSVELRYSSCSAEELIAQVIEEVRPVAASKNVKLLPEIDCPENIDCDRDRIVQVLMNLVANAIKFSPEGEGYPVRIICRAITYCALPLPLDKNSQDSQIDRPYALFEIIDSGPGIPASELGKLFERFHQVDSSDRRRRGGTGLGLTISRSLVQMHGGRIGVESEVGAGSRFWFVIPTRIFK